MASLDKDIDQEIVNALNSLNSGMLYVDNAGRVFDSRGDTGIVMPTCVRCGHPLSPYLYQSGSLWCETMIPSTDEFGPDACCNSCCTLEFDTRD